GDPVGSGVSWSRRNLLGFAVRLAGVGASSVGLSALGGCQLIGAPASAPTSTSSLARRLIRLGYLAGATREGLPPGNLGQALSKAFIDRLAEFGWVEGQNLAIDWRSSGGYVERFAGLAVELVTIPVDIIFVGAGTPAVVAAKQATSSIPIVATMENP